MYKRQGEHDTQFVGNIALSTKPLLTTPANEARNNTLYSATPTSYTTSNHTYGNASVEDIFEENENRYNLHSVANLEPLNETLKRHFIRKKFKPEGFLETTLTTTESVSYTHLPRWSSSVVF